MRLIAYKDRSNIDTILVKRNGVEFDMGAAGFTSTAIYAGGETIAGAISASELVFTLGSTDLPPGDYISQMVIVSPDYPDGLVIAGEGLAENLILKVV